MNPHANFRRLIALSMLSLWALGAGAQQLPGRPWVAGEEQARGAAPRPGASTERPEYPGFLCCNMRTDGKWISDANYADPGNRVIPVGTPLKITGYGRQRVHVEILGGRQSIGNDYSRDLDLGTFARRYVVTEDPRPKMASLPAKIREAIESARVTKGMSRDQVLMAIGYPMSSENPRLDSRVWRYWLTSFEEFQVMFDAAGVVVDVTAEPAIAAKVVLD